MTALVVSDLTKTTLDGDGVFDVLMRANKAHLDAEYTKNRIKGPEYSTVYLGSLETVMRTALEFLLQRQRIDLEAQLMTQQILVAQAEVAKMNAEVLIAQKKIELAQAELEIATAKLVNIPKEGVMLDKQALHVAQQTLNLVSEELNIPKQGKVLDATECKLKAEYDVLLLQKAKTTTETALLTQKVATEKAQITQAGVDDNSVVGRQKSLYLAQTNGIARDAEQKAADLMIKTWMTRRTTNDTEEVTGTNLDNPSIGTVVAKMKSGIGL